MQDSNLARSLMNLVEILMKDIPEEDNKYAKSWLIVSPFLKFEECNRNLKFAKYLCLLHVNCWIRCIKKNCAQSLEYGQLADGRASTQDWSYSFS